MPIQKGQREGHWPGQRETEGRRKALTESSMDGIPLSQLFTVQKVTVGNPLGFGCQQSFRVPLSIVEDRLHGQAGDMGPQVLCRASCPVWRKPSVTSQDEGGRDCCEDPYLKVAEGKKGRQAVGALGFYSGLWCVVATS